MSGRTWLGIELETRVRTRLMDNNITQALLARRLGVSEKHVSRVLRGHDDGSLIFWDAMLRMSGYPKTSTERGNRRSETNNLPLGPKMRIQPEHCAMYLASTDDYCKRKPAWRPANIAMIANEWFCKPHARDIAVAEGTWGVYRSGERVEEIPV